MDSHLLFMQQPSSSVPPTAPVIPLSSTPQQDPSKTKQKSVFERLGQTNSSNHSKATRKQRPGKRERKEWAQQANRQGNAPKRFKAADNANSNVPTSRQPIINEGNQLNGFRGQERCTQTQQLVRKQRVSAMSHFSILGLNNERLKFA